MQIKIKALGHGKTLLNRLSRPALLDSLMNFYRGLKLTADGRTFTWKSSPTYDFSVIWKYSCILETM